MSVPLEALDVSPFRQTTRTIWIALALSLLVHVALMWTWLPKLRFLSLDPLERDDARSTLVVELAPKAEEAASPAPPPQPAPAPATRAPAPRPAPAKPAEAAPAPAVTLNPAPEAPPAPTPPPSSPPPRAPSVPPPATVAAPSPIQLPPPAPAPAKPIEPPASLPPASLVPPPAVARPAPPRPPPEPEPVAQASAPAPAPPGDLSAYIEARRRARGEATSAPPPTEARPQLPPSTLPREDERARTNRQIAANLGLNRTPTAGQAPRSGGGLFEIQRVTRDYAEFIFFGFNPDNNRNQRQLVEVQRGENGDIRIAVVRKMIAIIRSEVPGDFMWVSQRLGRNLMLSARPEDNAELEAFLMQEFFGDPRRPN